MQSQTGALCSFREYHKLALQVKNEANLRNLKQYGATLICLQFFICSQTSGKPPMLKHINDVVVSLPCYREPFLNDIKPIHATTVCSNEGLVKEINDAGGVRAASFITINQS